VRRFLIGRLLPLAFSLLPLLAACLIAAALPQTAREFYIQRANPLDYLILILGTTLFLVQTLFAFRALCWRGNGFDQRADRWLTNLAQAAEWFPLLGLIGTVAGIMQTFASFDNASTVSQAEIIRRYAPAITATISGLFMALANILPTWVVLVGRDLIAALGGEKLTSPNSLPPTAELYGSSGADSQGKNYNTEPNQLRPPVLP
jgi:hypothetical protein